MLSALEEQSLAEASFLQSGEACAGRESVLGILQRHGQKRALSAGQTVLQEGDASDSIMLLLGGQLDVSVRQATGETTKINRLLPGTLFGEVGFYSQSRRSASVLAGQESEVLVISAEQMKRIELNAPGEAAQLHRALARVVADRLIAATLLLKDADA